jgi:hypothetical protein
MDKELLFELSLWLFLDNNSLFCFGLIPVLWTGPWSPDDLFTLEQYSSPTAILWDSICLLIFIFLFTLDIYLHCLKSLLLFVCKKLGAFSVNSLISIELNIMQHWFHYTFIYTLLKLRRKCLGLEWCLMGSFRHKK